MKDFGYVLRNFFTHKDFLVSPELIPGTIWTPLHIAFEAILVLVIVLSAIYFSKRKEKIRSCFIFLWAFLSVWEIVIIAWDSFAGINKSLDFTTSLSLYPCSIFLYAMPFIIWGNDMTKRMAYGYMCTLGFLGAAVNVFYPATRLTTYSCISFPGIHTSLYHGAMLFVYLVIMMAHLHSYKGVERLQDLFLSSVPGLMLSIPANIVNYSPIDADYMFFKGHFPLLASLFPNASEIEFTVVLYGLYLVVPALFYLPSYIAHVVRERKTSYAEEFAELCLEIEAELNMELNEEEEPSLIIESM